jgi:hypothetical protein
MVLEKDDISSILKHPIRKRILITIGDNEYIGATALKEKLHISTGSLYYNLRQLGKLVQQDDKRNYFLSEEGKIIYKQLKESGSLEYSNMLKIPSNLKNIFSNIFYPAWLFIPIYENKVLCSLTSLLSIGFLLLVFLYARFDLQIMYLTYSPGFGAELYLAKIILSIFFSWGYCILVSHILGGKGDNFRFLALIIISMLPLSFLPGIFLIDRKFKIGIFPPIGTTDFYFIESIFALIVQAISILLLTTAISYSKKIKLERAAIVSLSLFYITVLVNTITKSFSFL